ncbi:protein diaphanous homolog 3-like, partial [Python bivittatus]|uniref:Protein diaphanous homolog 3-like n=1 Tax=Python bivittatus TaxID=176946 RepID=A0A9F5N4E7_PYTBI
MPYSEEQQLRNSASEAESPQRRATAPSWRRRLTRGAIGASAPNQEAAFQPRGQVLAASAGEGGARAAGEFGPGSCLCTFAEPTMEKGLRGKPRENQPPRRQAAEALGSEGCSSSSSSSSSSKKAKFPLHLKILTDDVFDKFSSIRIPGSKKDRPALLHLKQSHCSSSECTTPVEVDDSMPTHLSDQEILVLFEKMMEDMNLNEDRKAPLREKDFSIKKEMVLQYTSTASKPGSLKSRRQILPQEFIYELKTGTVDEKLVSCLESLRVSLTSNPV